jgi:vacuolar-type H+-ATPase subunit I/STV1
MSWIELSSGLIACGANALFAGAQWRRTRRVGMAGVSAWTWGLLLANSVFWIVYGPLTNTWLGALGSALMFPFQLLLVIAAWRHHGPRIVLVSLGVATVLVAVPAVFLGAAAGVFGVAVMGVATRIPQLRELRAAPDASGVSVTSWSAATAGNAVWCVYWVSAHNYPALVPTAATGLLNLFIATAALRRHRAASARVRTA